MIKVLTVLGARPQFIKASIISKLIKESKFFNEKIIHTGQHFDKNMSDIFFSEMNIPKPDHNLDINNLNYSNMLNKMTIKIKELLINYEPDALIVYGDTNSTLAGALAGSSLKIPIFHIESGLRSFNRNMPEEINRTITDHLSSLLFCPNKNSVNNLIDENIIDNVIITGDIMYDSYIHFRKKIFSKTLISKKQFVLATIHRQENTDNKNTLREIFLNLDKINKKMNVIMPLHPRTKMFIEKYKINSNINFIEPLGYLDLISHLINSNFVITDSGGLQKEAFFAQKKCITVRKETEWTELLDIGVNFLSKPKELEHTFNKVMSKDPDFSPKIYGEGNAGKIILDSMKNYFG